MASLEEWFERTKRGTSGDMVIDILYDWKKENKMANIIDRIKEVIKIIQSEKDIEEIDFDDKELGIHIRVKKSNKHIEPTQ